MEAGYQPPNKPSQNPLHLSCDIRLKNKNKKNSCLLFIYLKCFPFLFILFDFSHCQQRGYSLSLILFYSLPLLSPKLLVFFLSNDYYMELLFFLSPCNLIAFFLFFLFFSSLFPPLSLSHFSLLYNVADFYYWFSFFIFTKASLFLLIFLLCFTLYLNPSPPFFLIELKFREGWRRKTEKVQGNGEFFFFFYLILIFFFAFFFPFFCPLLLFSLPVWMTLN